MLSRSVSLVSKRTATRFTRMYSNGSGNEGAIRNASGSFSDKEKAVENQWARLHDAEKLKALKEALEQQKNETAQLRKDLEELKKAKK